MKAVTKKSHGSKGGRPTTLQVATKAQASLPLELLLTERMKELNCLQQIAPIIAANQGTLDELLWQTIEASQKPGCIPATPLPGSSGATRFIRQAIWSVANRFSHPRSEPMTTSTD